MAFGNAETDRLAKQASSLSHQLQALAVEYRDEGRSATDKPHPGDADSGHRTLDRQTLHRLLRVLQPQGLIDELRLQGLGEVADKLDDQWKATARLSDSSEKSDSVERQAVNAMASSKAFSIALSDFSMKDWTRVDYMGQLRGIDNSGLLDYVENSTLESLSDEEFQRLYERLDEFSYQRVRAWQADYLEDLRAKARTKDLIWLMYQAGYSATAIAEAMCESLDNVQHMLMWAMTNAGVPDSTIVASLGVTIEDIDRVVWTRTKAVGTDSSDDVGGDAEYIDVEDEADEVDPNDQMFQLGHVFYNLSLDPPMK